MEFSRSTSPFLHQGYDVPTIMREVLFALIPGIAIYVWFFGWGIVVNIFLTSITALVCEAFMLWLRGRPIRPFLTDYSALVTAWLLASALSPFLPWWVSVLGTAFAIIFAKHLYGGLGYNPFNPAVVGYAVLLISFPSEMTLWPALASLSGHYPGLLESISIIFTGQPTQALTLDAITSATPLDTMKTQLRHFYTVAEITGNNPIFGIKEGVWIVGGFLLGGIWLIYRKLITWHIPVGVLAGLTIMAGLFFLWDPDLYPSPLFHFLTGGCVIGAFFIATDPVTSAASNKGRLIYGLGIGVLIYVIRTWGGYPDGVAFAVLCMNMAVPLIDNYTQPRVFGH